jgi:hypothetical protein
MKKERKQQVIPAVQFPEKPSLADAPAAPMYIFIAIPAGNYVTAGFMYDLAQMIGFSTATLVNDRIADISINMVEGTYVHMARQDLIYQAVKVGATHILWLDSDHRFPRNLLIRLLQHNKDMVGINYSTRKDPLRFVGFKEVKREKGLPSVPLITAPDSTGLEECDALGFGALLMRTPPLDDFWDCHEEGPWFNIVWEHDLERWMGEDVYFCEQWRAAGYKIWCDHDLSKECLHSGWWQYETNHAYAWMQKTQEQEEQDGDNELQRAADVDRDVAESE